MLPGNPRQVRTNYRCSDQGLAGFACRTSTAPDSAQSQPHATGLRNAYFHAPHFPEAEIIAKPAALGHHCHILLANNRQTRPLSSVLIGLDYGYSNTQAERDPRAAIQYPITS